MATESGSKRVSASREDYLEAIVELGGTPKRPIRPVDVASKLGVSKASVTKAVASLKEAGMLDQPYYGDITLTSDGYEYGSKVLERHTMLYEFLHDVLGVPAERADDEACLIEHDISDSTAEAWIAYMRNAKRAK
ncbi:metal-dependent transcriptional regulator [Denitrobacterium detoxificans]|uniref:Iron (Metal) dependent repressor, DtxR family n=1 Tax=Denitrobacterium detoxificans TaxID=79604 RepID=A0A1H8U485_9ACTN|nr:metal-dependent transcriptional regulator [Denitrobacterium detoxificans]SEO98092.1 iron (metal) dependent repressor, DtxR family [Denitrobacterium detoxificans]